MKLQVAMSQQRSMLDALFENYSGSPFAIELWDGWTWYSTGSGVPACRIIIRSAGALQALIAHPSEITLGEAFLANDIDVKGDLISVFDVAEHVFHCPRGRRRQIFENMTGVLLGLGHLVKAGRLHSQQRDRAAIAYHYDQPPAFYEPWLGKTLVYSCAYFASENDSLDTAQTNKLDLICRKLRLQPCERFLDIGCGWGSLILHAASHYGVEAQGITLSEEQKRVAVERIERARLTQSCEVELLDYRKAVNTLPDFDKIASVGMFEHVGMANLPLYFRTAHTLLKSGGVFLNHGIARAHSSMGQNDSFLYGVLAPFLRNALHLSRPHHSSFIDKYVFPDGELVTLSEAVRAAEAAGFEVRDVENLREHYELTLRHWVQGMQQNSGVLLALVPETTYRIWLLYMAASAAAFRRGDIAVYQMLLSKPKKGQCGLPLTRNHLYHPPQIP